MATAAPARKSEIIVGGKYRLMRRIGAGSFGEIYLAINTTNGEVNYLNCLHWRIQFVVGGDEGLITLLFVFVRYRKWQ